MIEEYLKTIESNAEEVDRLGRMSASSLDALAATNLMMLPFEGADMIACCDAVAKVSERCPNVGLLLAMHYIYSARLLDGGYGDNAIAAVRTVAKKGKMINSFGVEKELGTPSRGGIPETKLIKTEGGWVVRGHKIYCSGAGHLGFYFVRAHVVDGDPEPRNALALVDAASPGIEIIQTWDHLGMRGTESNDIIFHDVPVVKGGIGSYTYLGRPNSFPHNEWNNLMLASMYNGMARRTRSWFVDWAVNRRPTNLNGASIGSLPRTQEQIGMMDTLLTANDLMIYGAAMRSMNHEIRAIKTSQVKIAVADNCLEVAEIAVRNSGNNAMTRHNPMERYWRDMQTIRYNVPQADTVYVRSGRSLVADAGAH